MEVYDLLLATSRDATYLVGHHPVYSAVGAIVLLMLLLRFYCRLTLGMCDCEQDMRGKTVLITGASAGIGKQTALDLARRHARVLLACRNRSKAEKVAEEIISATGNQQVFVKQLDLTSFKSVRKCAEEILKTEDRLDVLINNAGIYGGPSAQQQKTEDNNEQVMQSNHLGHFLLTLLLIGLLKKSSPSRIINVSSMAYQYAQLDTEDLNNSKKLHPLVVYSNSKLANILFTKELSERLGNTGVTVNALHPGVVQTDIFQEGDFISVSSNIFSRLFGKTSFEGAQTSINLAVNPELEKTTGKYFADCKEDPLKTSLVTKTEAKRLFEKSEQICDIKWT